MIRDKFRRSGVCSNRYVRKHRINDYYEWCEQDAVSPQYDIAQGTCEEDDLPDHIKDACDKYKGYFYACEWPFE